MRKVIRLARKAVRFLSSGFTPSVRTKKIGMLPKGSTMKKTKEKEIRANSNVEYIFPHLWKKG